MIKSFKGFVSGFLVACLLLTVGFTASASVREFMLKQVSYPVLVDGKEYKSTEYPVLSYEGGTTYVPLRAFCEIVGKEIKWNTELSRIEISKPAYVSQSDPAKHYIEPNISEGTLFEQDGVNYAIYNGKQYIECHYVIRQLEKKYYKFDLTTLPASVTNLNSSEVVIKDIETLVFIITLKPTLTLSDMYFDYEVYKKQILPLIEG